MKRMESGILRLERGGRASSSPHGAAMRQVVIYAGEDAYWVAECPSLPGCMSQGKTREEAVRNIRKAVSGYVFSRLL